MVNNAKYKHSSINWRCKKLNNNISELSWHITVWTRFVNYFSLARNFLKNWYKLHCILIPHIVLPLPYQNGKVVPRYYHLPLPLNHCNLSYSFASTIIISVGCIVFLNIVLPLPSKLIQVVGHDPGIWNCPIREAGNEAFMKWSNMLVPMKIMAAQSNFCNQGCFTCCL